MTLWIGMLFGLAASAASQQVGVEMMVNAQGDTENMDAVSMLQNLGVSEGAIKLGARDSTSTQGLQGPQADPLSRLNVDLKAVVAEYIAMTLFVIIGCGSAMGVAKEPGWVLQVALSFGFAISALAYAIGHYSGGQINCAVTLGLVLVGNLGIYQALANFIAQMLGATTGCFILTLMCPESMDKTKGLGSNGVSEGYSVGNALIGEAVMTFLLMFVVLETAVNSATQSSRALACLAIGLAVFLAHSVLIPITGCSINPTRSFGPAFISTLFYKDADTFKDHWVFWMGPLAGAAGAALVYSVINTEGGVLP